MRTCKHCGARLGETSNRYCEHCGTSLATEASRPSAPPPVPPPPPASPNVGTAPPPLPPMPPHRAEAAPTPPPPRVVHEPEVLPPPPVSGPDTGQFSDSPGAAAKAFLVSAAIFLIPCCGIGLVLLFLLTMLGMKSPTRS